MPCPTRKLTTLSQRTQHQHHRNASSLLDLPPKIRTAVFELVLRRETPLEYTCFHTRPDGRPSCGARTSPDDGSDLLWALLLTNKLVHAEAAWMLTGLNTLHFSSLQAVKCFRGFHLVDQLRRLSGNVQFTIVPVPPAQVDNLESLVLDFVKFRRRDFGKLFGALRPLRRLRRVVLMTHKRRKIDPRLERKLKEALPEVVDVRVYVSERPLEDSLHGTYMSGWYWEGLAV